MVDHVNKVAKDFRQNPFYEVSKYINPLAIY